MLLPVRALAGVRIFASAFVLFFVLAVSSILLARLSGDVAIFWPANAAIVALCLISGLRCLPSALFGAFLANISAQILFGDPITSIMGFPVANCLEIFFVSIALRLLKLDEGPISSAKDVMFFLLALCAALMPSALLGAAIVSLVFAGPYYGNFIFWWVGDIVSAIIVLLPLVSTGWPHKWRLSLNGERLLKIGRETAIFLAFLTLNMSVLNALGMPVVLAIMAPSFWMALDGKPFKVAVACGVFILGVSAAVIAGIWPTNGLSDTLRDQVFEVQIFTLFAVLPSYAIAVAIFDLARSKEEMTQSNMRLSVTLANMNQGVSCFDDQFKLTVWNEKYVQMFDMTSRDVEQIRQFEDLLKLQKSNGNFSGTPQKLLDDILSCVWVGKEFVAETELSNGRVIKSVHSPTPLGGWIATHEDITEMRAMERRLAYESLHDPLTGLPNRRYFDQEMRQRIEAKTDKCSPITLFFVDLDHFKQINDNVGHNAGDAALQHIGRAIRENIDEADFVARLGGDEFAIISTRFENSEKAGNMAERLNAELRAPFYFNGQQVCCDVSIGITMGQGTNIDVERLRAEADVALYGAKRAGRGQHQVYRAKGKVA